MSQTLVLGAIAGVTIFLGLPVGRLKNPRPGLRVLLNAIAVGVLVFLLWDVLSAAWEPIDAALSGAPDGRGDTSTILGYGLLFVLGLSVGLLALVGYESWMRVQRSRPAHPFGPGSMHTAELRRPRGTAGELSPQRRLAVMIAVGIGLHNFAEGLAIGQAAASGAIALATLLVVGFALHNATEGFGIVAPLAGDAAGPPSWSFLALLGLIGGGPTFLGAAVGQRFTSDPVSIVFLTLAAGSILYVVIQLITVAAKAKRPNLLAFGLLLGLVAGFATDAVVTLAGV